VGVANKYRYQGKELQDGLGLDLYDFHARQYDPLLGRFTSVDPMNQFASGYVGMGNNPVNMVDPNGQLAFAALGGGIMLQGVTVTASALTAGALVKGAALMAGKFALTTAASGIVSGIGGGIGGCCPGTGTYQNPYSSRQVEGMSPYGNVSYYGGVPQPFTPMAPVSPVSSQSINALEGLQLAGDIASFIPGVNTIGGLTSAGASLAMGNYGAAAFAAATAIPVAGVALKVGKAALAGVKAARAAKVAPRLIGPAGDAGGTVLKQIPSNWIMKPAKNGPGTRFIDPTNPSSHIRVMRGKPNSPFLNSRNPYTVRYVNGSPVDQFGNRIPNLLGRHQNLSPALHVPVEQFRFY
jgi:RHS repeat-associated protein